MDEATIALYNARAGDYDEMTRHEAPDPLLAEFMARLRPGDRVLDLGCGPGTFAAQMAAAGLNPEAWDASAEMVALAKRHAGVTARLAGFDDLQTAQHYHGVWANFSLLHAAKADLPRHLLAIKRALIAGGQFQIALKRGDGEQRDRLGRFYSYYQEDELHGLLRDAGFTVTKTVHGRDKGLDGTFSDWLSVASHA